MLLALKVLLGLSFLTVSSYNLCSESPLDQALNFVQQPEMSYKTNIAYIAAKIQAGLRTYGKVVLKYAVVPGIVCVPTIAWILERRKNKRLQHEFTVAENERNGLNVQLQEAETRIQAVDHARQRLQNQLRQEKQKIDVVDKEKKNLEQERNELKQQLEQPTNTTAVQTNVSTTELTDTESADNTNPEKDNNQSSNGYGYWLPSIPKIWPFK